MEDFPGNSHTDGRPARSKKPEDKKFTKVVEGKVTRRKKPLRRRFAEAFGAGDPRGVSGFVMEDVIVPGFKDLLSETFDVIKDRLLFPDMDSRSAMRRRRSYGGGGLFDRNRDADTPYHLVGRGRGGEPRDRDRGRRRTHDFDDILLPSRHEAEEVIDRMLDALSRYEIVTVADLYEMLGVDAEYTDGRWGWADLHDAGVRRVGGGYLLELPRPLPVD